MNAEYIDHMGSDLTVVNAARVSFDKESGEFGGSDARLIVFLAKHGHFTPFTHAMVTLREEVPIFVARQRFKHTVGFSYNEVSRRYVSDAPQFYAPESWRLAADTVKQGSSPEALDDAGRTSKAVSDHNDNCLNLYQRMIGEGICAEQARMILPQSMFTSYYVTGSLAAWARAYQLRIEKTAQAEIQVLARTWDAVIKPLFPVSWAALTEEHIAQ
tara:strand:+ start:2763 stop:3407 length:645 start_codon:yes stop_codon:yes gene_type:complete